jgi:hypothetical protein
MLKGRPWLLVAGLVATSALAEARRRQPLNMPPGWVWPPSPAMIEEGRGCLRRLERLGLRFQRSGPVPRVVTPIVVTELDFAGLRLLPRGKGPQLLDCQLAEALAAVAAPELRALGVSALRVGTLHRLRHIRGTRILSRHALGLALDVMAFVDAEGKEHPVTGYGRDPLLPRIAARLRACGAFRRPLTPGNDRRHHRDHLHLEARTAAERARRAWPGS